MFLWSLYTNESKEITDFNTHIELSLYPDIYLHNLMNILINWLNFIKTPTHVISQVSY